MKVHLLAALASAALLACGAARADERESLEQLRTTTLGLINALVETGAITRARADELIRAAGPKPAWGDAPRPEGGVAPAPVVRVPYVSETVRKQIRDEVRQDVLAQARSERWTDPARLPDWLDRISLYGDLRVRLQGEKFASDNTPAGAYDLRGQNNADLATRWADLADNGLAAGNTQTGSNMLRLRARLGTEVKVSPDTSADLRIATGSNASATSTNQTLTGNFGKYSLWLDRAVLRTRLAPWLLLQAGRMPPPFEANDGVWDEDLHFDGLALRLQAPDPLGSGPYASVGAFPLQAASHPSRPKASWLFGGQVGINWDVSPRTRLKASAAIYDFDGIEGVRELDSRLDPVLLTPNVNDYAATGYAASLRRKGNTLVRINAPGDTGTTVWGLASRFRPLHLNLGAEVYHFSPLVLRLGVDYLRNTAFDRAEIAARTGLVFGDGRADGWQLRTQIGMAQLKNRGDWSASLAYRLVGSDVMPDGFVDSDFGLGGTNQKGFVLGGNWAFDRNTTAGLKLLTARSLSSPTMRSDSHSFSADVLQADLQVRF